MLILANILLFISFMIIMLASALMEDIFTLWSKEFSSFVSKIFYIYPLIILWLNLKLVKMKSKMKLFLIVLMSETLFGLYSYLVFLISTNFRIYLNLPI